MKPLIPPVLSLASAALLGCGADRSLGPTCPTRYGAAIAVVARDGLTSERTT